MARRSSAMDSSSKRGHSRQLGHGRIGDIGTAERQAFERGERREDATVGAEIGMAHVGTFGGVFHPEGEPAEISGRHHRSVGTIVHTRVGRFVWTRLEAGLQSKTRPTRRRDSHAV